MSTPAGCCVDSIVPHALSKMITENQEIWQSLFENWPDIIKRQGAVVTKRGEAIPFVDFLVSCGLLLIERDGPDASGARKVIVAYDTIAMIKLSATGALSQFQTMGFQPTL